MTEPVYGPFQVAGEVEPLSTASSSQALLDADKTLYYLIDFMSYVIRAYPGPRIVQVANAYNVKSSNGAFSDAIAERYPIDIGPHMNEPQLQFPLFAAWRTTTTFKQKTAGWEEDTSRFSMIYVLPSLTIDQAVRMLPLLTAVKQSMRTKLTQSYDPGYTPPPSTSTSPAPVAGQSPWESAYANIDEIGFRSSDYGYLERANNLFFPALRMDVYALERDMYYEPGAKKFTGADITADLYGPDGTLIDPFVQVSTQQAPVITGLSVRTGPVIGGTTVVITGLRFLQGPKLSVVFGSVPVQPVNVTWNSSTQVTVVTSAMAGTGTVGVTLINADGQVAASPQTFTFV